MPAFPGRGLFLDLIMAQAVTVEPGVPIDLSNAFIFYDSRNYCGNGVMVNEGTGGSVWDLLVEQANLNLTWGIKRLNWYSNPDLGGPWPTTAADIGGDSCTGMLQVTAIPNALFNTGGQTYTECEWILQQDQSPFDLFAYWGVYLDDFSNLETIDGNVWTYTDEYDNYIEWDPEAEYDTVFNTGATGVSPIGISLIAQWFDVASQEAKVWVVDQRGATLVVSATGPGTDDDTNSSDFAAACGTVGFPGEGSNALEMFWSMSYHTGWRSPGTRTQWNGVIGQGLWRTGPPTEASLTALFDYFNDGPLLTLQSDGFDSFATGSFVAAAMTMNGAVDQTAIYALDSASRLRVIGINPPTNATQLGELFNGALANATDIAMNPASNLRALVATPTQLVSVRTTTPTSMYVDATKTDATVLSAPTHVVHSRPSNRWLITGGNGYLVEASLSTGLITITNSLSCNAVGGPCGFYQGNGIYYMVPHSSGGLVVVARTGFSVSDTLIDADMTGATEVVAKTISWPGAYAFVACPSTGKVVVVDVTDPSNISKSTVISGLSSPHELQVWGSTLIIPGNGVIYFYDISDPTNPTLQTTETSLPHGATAGVASFADFLATTDGQVYSLVGEAVPLAQVDRITDGDLLQTARGIDVYGDYLFVVGPFADIPPGGGNTGGLAVIDKSNPASMSIVAQLQLADAWDIAISDNGQYAYITGSNADCIYSVDISTPTAPSLDDTLTDATVFNRLLGIRLTGNYAVCTAYNGDRLVIIDVSNPSAMSTSAALYDAVNLNGPADLVLSADGNIAYVSCSNRFTTVDITTKTATPSVLDSYQGGISGAEAVVLDESGRYAYQCNDFNGSVLVFDVTNPSSITLETTVPGLAGGLGPATAFVYEDRLWFGGGTGQGVQAYDITDPADPKFITYIGEDDTDLYCAYGMVYDPADGHLYVTSYCPNLVTAFQTAAQCVHVPPVPLGTVDSVAISQPERIAKVGDYLFVTNASDSLYIIDASDPSNILTVKSISLKGAYSNRTLYDIVPSATGDHLFISDFSHGRLIVVDVTDPLNPSVVFDDVPASNPASFASTPKGMDRMGSHLYVAHANNALSIVDISTPSAPTCVGKVSDITNLANNEYVACEGNYCYVTSYSARRVTKVNVSNPASPTITGQLFDNTNLLGANGIVVDGNYAYVACISGNRVTVLNITGSNPSVTGTVADGTQLYGAAQLVKTGNKLQVVAAFGGRVTTVDVSAPTSPFVYYSVSSGLLGGPQDIVMDGSLGFVAAKSSNDVTVVSLPT